MDSIVLGSLSRLAAFKGDCGSRGDDEFSKRNLARFRKVVISELTAVSCKTMFKNNLSSVSNPICLGSFLVAPLFLGSQGNRSDGKLFEQRGDVEVRRDFGHQFLIE